MQFKDLVLSTLCLAAAVRAQSSGQVKVHAVQVGANGTLTFNPNQLQVNPGEFVQFQFHPKNHSVVQSTFNNPCTPMEETMPGMVGIKSGFMPVAADATEIPVFTIRVNDTKPIWLYCSQATHCQKGMVMAINVAQGTNKTFEAFRALAMQSGSTTSSTGSSSTGTTDSSSSSSSSDSSNTSGSSSTSDTSSTSGSSTSSSDSSSSTATISSSNSTATSSVPVQTANGAARPVVNAAGLLALFIAGFAYIGL